MTRLLQLNLIFPHSYSIINTVLLVWTKNLQQSRIFSYKIQGLYVCLNEFYDSCIEYLFQTLRQVLGYLKTQEGRLTISSPRLTFSQNGEKGWENKWTQTRDLYIFIVGYFLICSSLLLHHVPSWSRQMVKHPLWSFLRFLLLKKGCFFPPQLPKFCSRGNCRFSFSNMARSWPNYVK